MKFRNQIDVLHESKQLIRGDEPFLSFHRPSMIVNLRDYSGASHNFVDSSSGTTACLCDLQRGDTLRFQFCRVRPVKIPWYKFWERWTK
jgi:hypothetical protein